MRGGESDFPRIESPFHRYGDHRHGKTSQEITQSDNQILLNRLDLDLHRQSEIGEKERKDVEELFVTRLLNARGDEREEKHGSSHSQQYFGGKGKRINTRPIRVDGIKISVRVEEAVVGKASRIDVEQDST